MNVLKMIDTDILIDVGRGVQEAVDFLAKTQLYDVPAMYDQIVKLLDDLIDEVGEDESHSLASMMKILGVLIEHYEINHVPELTSN